jgi:hypothetical protein
MVLGFSYVAFFKFGPQTHGPDSRQNGTVASAALDGPSVGRCLRLYVEVKR